MQGLGRARQGDTLTVDEGLPYRRLGKCLGEVSDSMILLITAETSKTTTIFT